MLLIFAVLAIELFAAQFLELKQNISDTFPQTEKFEKYTEIIEHRGLNSTVYFSLSPKKVKTYQAVIGWIQVNSSLKI